MYMYRPLMTPSEPLSIEIFSGYPSDPPLGRPFDSARPTPKRTRGRTTSLVGDGRWVKIQIAMHPQKGSNSCTVVCVCVVGYDKIIGALSLV